MRPAAKPAVIAPSRRRFTTAIRLAFGGIAAILIIAVGLAFYASEQMNSALDYNTQQLMPETLAALRLSERSTLLAALAPTLASADDTGQLQQLAKQLDTLLQEIDNHISQLTAHADPGAVVILRDQVASLGAALRALKQANARRIILTGQQNALLPQIRAVHNELNDTVSPVVYSVASLSQLMAKRTIRQTVAPITELQEPQFQQIASLLELRLLLARLTAASVDDDSRQATLTLMRAALGRLQSSGHADQPNCQPLADRAAQILEASRQPRQPDQAEQELNTLIERCLAQNRRLQTERLRQGLDQVQSAVLALIEQALRNLGYALDIRAEGNLLFALLSTVADVTDASSLIGAQDRFKHSFAIFQTAAQPFQTGELAQRNPVLASSVSHIQQCLTQFGAGEENLFTLRRQLLDRLEQIRRLLDTSRHIAKAMTDQINKLVEQAQANAKQMQAALAMRQIRLQWAQIWVGAGGLLLASLIAWWTTRVLNRHERDLRTAKEVADSAHCALRIAATAFEAQVGIVVTDPDSVILQINQTFTDITGYAAEAVVGQKMRLIQSGRHDAAFYAAMWESIHRTGSWQGEIWDRRQSGEIYPAWLTISTVKGDNDAVTHYVGTQIDISQRKAAEDEITYLAFYDPLTHLPNRRLLLDRLRQALAISARNQQQGALLFIDLDHFKNLNDTLGHDIGDLLLKQVALRLSKCVREGDTIARLGGDEFVIMLEHLGKNLCEAAAKVEIVGEKILGLLNQPYHLAAHERHSTPSIGITLFSGHQESVEELLKQADLAMYQAKAAGRNTLRFFNSAMQATLSTYAALEADLRLGVKEGQFLLHYQPQVDSAGRLIGAEALVRWQHPQRGRVSPAQFIPLAEETGLILPLGQWVLETACQQLAVWADQADWGGITLAVNVSARQFRHPDFVKQVLAGLDRNGADPQRLKLELTESLLLDDVEDTIAKMTALKTQGVRFSLDDFGTGYSSLSYLKRLPLDQLKIDQSFVRDVLTDPNDAAIAKTIVALARSLGLAVIAEGVETEEQRDFLARHDCHAFQGYLFGRPVPVEQLHSGHYPLRPNPVTVTDAIFQ